MRDIASLFRSYSADLQRFLQRRGAAQDLAADLTQEAFLRLMTAAKRRAGSPPPDNNRAYLFRIAANLQIDHARRHKVLPLTGDDMALRETIADPSPLADEIIISAEAMRILAQALEEIPDGPRQVYMMRLDGKTFAEIGQELRIPKQTVYSQLGRVLMHLRYRLEQAQKGWRRTGHDARPTAGQAGGQSFRRLVR